MQRVLNSAMLCAYGVSVYGCTAAGHPIFVLQLGQLDSARIQDTFDAEALTAQFIRDLEFINGYLKDRISMDRSAAVYKQVTILDCEGCGMKFMSVKAVVTELLKVMDRYPESLERMFLVNVAWCEDD